MVASTWQRILTKVRRTVMKFEDERTETRSSFTLTVTVEADTLDGGYVATLNDAPGILSQGDTVEEAVENLMEAFRESLIANISDEVGELSADRQSPDRRGPATFKVAVGC